MIAAYQARTQPLSKGGYIIVEGGGGGGCRNANANAIQPEVHYKKSAYT